MTAGSEATKRWRKKYPEKARALARTARARYRQRYPEKIKADNDKYNNVVSVRCDPGDLDIDVVSAIPPK